MFMNWFTNKCEALVDERGLALKGEALAAARQNPHAKKCGNLIRIGANCCRICGAPAPGRTLTCGNCGAKVSTVAQFCSECGTALDIEGRDQLVGGIWRPAPDIFAKRFELDGLQNILQKGLDVQNGQAAIILVAGEATDVLPPGHYSFEELANFKNPKKEKCSVVMVRLAELEFPLRISGLRTQEDMEAALVCSVVLQFNPSLATQFMSNIMANPTYVTGDVQSAFLTFDAIAFNLLIGELQVAARDFCNAHSVDTIFLDPECRVELFNTMSRALSEKLKSAGLDFERLEKINFLGPAFEELRRQNGELEVRRRELEYELRAQQMELDHNRLSEESRSENENALRQLAKELKISDLVRDREIERVQESHRVEREIAALELNYQKNKKGLTDGAELAVLKAKHDEELKAIQQNGEMERRQKEHAEQLRQKIADQRAALECAQLEDSIQKLKNDAIHLRTLQILEEQRLAEEAKADAEKKRIERLEGVSLSTLLAMANDAVSKDAILEAMKIQQASSLTSEQALAAAVREGVPGAADALLRMDKGLAEERRQELERVIQLNERNVQSFERIAIKSMEASSEAAKGNNTTTQIVK